MKRTAVLLLAALLVACSSAAPGAVEAPTKTPDIKRAVLDVMYSAMTDNDVHKVSSRKVLTAALDGVKARVKQLGGDDKVATPDFADVSETTFADFKKMASAIEELAKKNPQLSANTILESAGTAMVRSSPDCHTYWVTAARSVIQSRPEPRTGGPAQPPANATPPDEAGLRYALVGGNVGYVTFREYMAHATYDITTQVKKALDALVAQGAKAWMFDLRGNRGGDPPQVMTSWFLNGEPTMKIEVRTGQAGTQTAKKDFRLPDTYQLPIAIIVNDTGGSSPEVFTLGLKENKRAVVVGGKTTGCLGATTTPIPLQDGGQLNVVTQQFVGAQTGARYNNTGIPPDVPASDAEAVSKATAILQELIAKGKLYP